MIYARVFQNGVEGNSSYLGDFRFASLPRAEDGIVIDGDGKRRSMDVTSIVHLGVKAEGDQPFSYLHRDVVWENDV